MSDGALHLVAREHLVGELERLRAPQGAGHEALQLTAGGELGGDALEDTVADERARDLLRQRSGERPVDDARDLGRGQDLVDGFFDRPTPGPRGRAGRVEGGAPGRVCQAGLALSSFDAFTSGSALGVSARHAPTLDYQPVARQHPSPPVAGRRRRGAGRGAPWSCCRQPARMPCTLAAPRIGPSGHLEVRGVEDERPGLEAAHAAVEGDQLLEGAALVEVGVVEAADHDVADVLEAVGAQQVLRRVRREVGERVLAVDATLREVVGAVGAERDGAVLARSGRAASRRAGGCGAPGSAPDGARRSPRASAGGAPPSGR